MTGKYIKFTLPTGQTIAGKGPFSIRTGINIYTIVKLMSNRKSGTIIYEDIEYQFEMIYGNPATRSYIPNKKTDDRYINNKHIKFTDENGNVTIGKRRMCVLLGIPECKLVALYKRKASGAFKYNDITYTFHLHIPEPSGTKPSKAQREPKLVQSTYVKIIGNLELLYSSHSGNLLSTKTISV